MHRMFTPVKNQNAAENTKLIELTKQGFYSLTSTEAGLFHSVPFALLEALDVNNKDFDYQYNQIIFGSIVIELAIEADKYFCHDKIELYPKTVGQLRELCGIEKFPHPLAAWQPEALQKNNNCINLIKGVGQLILDEKLEFTSLHLEHHIIRSRKYILNHLPGGCDKDAAQEKHDALNNLLKDRLTQLLTPSPKYSHSKEDSHSNRCMIF